MSESGSFIFRPRPDCELAPRKYERKTSRIGGTSGGLGRGARGFWSKVRKDRSGCWIWIGYLDKGGYGKFTSTLALDGSRLPKPRTFRPHRALYEQMHGPIAPGLVLMHTCDVPRCVNPEHLRPGTQGENIRDCYAKGRHENKADTRGEMSGCAKLRDEDVLFIRAQPKANCVCEILAALFHVSVHTIHQVRGRRTWRHLGNGNAQNAMTLPQLRALLAARREEEEQARAALFDAAQARTGEAA